MPMEMLGQGTDKYDFVDRLEEGYNFKARLTPHGT